MLADTVRVVLAALPGVGLLFKGLEIVDIAERFRETTRSIYAVKLKEQVDEAQKYIANYLAALTAWCNTAVAVQQSYTETAQRILGEELNA